MLGVFEYDHRVLKAIEQVYGDSRSFLEAISMPSRRLYIRVNTLRITPEDLLDRLRSRGLEVYRDEELAEALYFPVKGPNKVDSEKPRVVVDKRAAESVYMGANLYAPGVIDCDESITPGTEVTIVSPRGFVVGEGVAEMSCWDMKRRRKGLAVRVTRSVFEAPRLRELPEYREGLFYPQSLPAMYVTHVLDPKPGEVVVDMCAAPGGKTGHIVELSQGRAYVLAFDHSRSKILELYENMRRLGHTYAVEIWRADSRYLHIDYPWIRADKVLVDPPCSALGVRPKIEDSKTWRDIEASAQYQIQFLRTAIRIAKIGGVIVYSTCTITIEENEMVIERIVEEEKCVEVVDTGIRRSSRGVYGVFRDLYTRFHPTLHDVTGYFIAKLVKVCES